MDARDRRVRQYVFARFLETAGAPVVEELAPALGLSLSEARAALKRLDEAHHLKLIDGTSRILMAFPFSAVATPYRVTRSNGQRYFANCAWDAVAFHPMLNEPIRVDSYCQHCNAPLAFRVERGVGVAEAGPLPLVHLGLPAAAWWDDIVRTCSNTMVYVASAEHLADWRSAGGPGEGRAVSIADLLEMSVPIYEGRLRPDYERPPTTAIQATFERLGLVDPFWKL